MNKSIVLLLLIILTVFMLAGCQQRNDQSQQTITIAEQYGLAYAPVQIMKDKKMLEKNLLLDQKLAGVNVEWKKLSNTAAIREAMLAGRVDAGFMAIPPFLIGRDKGMDWKIISGLSMSPLGLMTYKDRIKTLSDLKKDDRIALPQPGSIEHILLAMAAEREFADATRFDQQLVTMNHPDGMNALLSRKDITAHFTAPPYLFQESEQPGIHLLLSGKEALGGEFSFIVGVCPADFHDSNPALYQVFVKSLWQAIAFINQQPAEAASLLAADYGLSEEEIEKDINWPGMYYGKEVRGLDKFIKFMQQAKYIELKNQKSAQLFWDEDLYEKE